MLGDDGAARRRGAASRRELEGAQPQARTVGGTRAARAGAYTARAPQRAPSAGGFWDTLPAEAAIFAANLQCPAAAVRPVAPAAALADRRLIGDHCTAMVPLR